MGPNEFIQKFVDLRPLPELKKALAILREMKREHLERNENRKGFFKRDK